MGSRILVTAGSNMAFLSVIQAITLPGDEIILPSPFYFNHEMAVRIADCVPVLVPTDAEYQIDPDALAARDHAAHAGHRHRLAQQPDRGRLPRSDASRRQRALRAPRAAAHLGRSVRGTSPGTGHALLAGLAPRRGRAHDLALLAVEGVRLRGLAHRLHGDPRGAERGRLQGAGHGADLPAAGVAGRGARVRAGGPHVDRWLPRPARAPSGARCWTLFASVADLCDVPDAGRRVLLPAARADAARCAMTVMERLVREHKVAAIAGETFGLTEGCYLRVSYGALAGETVKEGMPRLVTGLRAICGPYCATEPL